MIDSAHRGDGPSSGCSVRSERKRQARSEGGEFIAGSMTDLFERLRLDHSLRCRLKWSGRGDVAAAVANPGVASP